MGKKKRKAFTQRHMPCGRPPGVVEHDLRRRGYAVHVRLLSIATMATTQDGDKYPHSAHENDGQSRYGGRDLIGYGDNTPKFLWPSKGKVALNFVVS